jgi:hypothetical protein
MPFPETTAALDQALHEIRTSPDLWFTGRNQAGEPSPVAKTWEKGLDYVS